MKNLNLVRYNPTEIQRYIHRAMVDISAGKYEILDPSNPFAFLLEVAATLAASNAVESKVNNRKQYSSMAQTKEDLYRHMSDHDFADICATPAEAPFIIGFAKDELLQAMVDVPGSDMRKLVIPRNTTMTVSDTIFSLQYPIEIRQMGHGGIQVVWDTEITSPLLTLDTNVIDSGFVTNTDGVEMLMFSVPTKQFSIKSLVETSSLGRKFKMNLSIEHQFHYCRVWSETSPNNWVELPTTYSQEIYPINKPTAIVIVDGKQVSVELPIVYQKSGLISGKIRVDVYQTRGPITMDLGSYDHRQFVANWLAIDKSEQNEYVAPLKKIKTVLLYSNAVVSGGSNEMDFDSLRNRVMENGFGPILLPITPAQAQSRLERKGYNIVKNIDNVTQRIFKATREMPAPQDPELITPAAAGIHMLSETVERLAMLSTTYENTNSLTVSPQTLYSIASGIVRVVPESERAMIDAMPGDKKAQLITNGSYFYSPFHYVLDTTNNTFAVRPYYLDNPRINSRSFIAENDTTLLQVSVSSYSIDRTSAGWSIMVTTNSSEDWKNIQSDRLFAVIGYRPDRTGDFAYIKGELVGNLDSGEQVWRFDVNTTYDINSDNKLELSNAMMYEISQQFHRCSLSEEFDIFFSTSEPMPDGWKAASFDNLIGTFLVDNGAVGVTRERLKVTFGYALTNLWSRARSVVGEEQYAKWDVDVPATYLADEYELDPVTGRPKFTIVAGKITFNKTHSMGDIQYDSEGKIIYRYVKGDVKRDAYGKPIVTNTRGVVRQMDLFLLEAPYYFATNDAAVKYRQLLVNMLVEWVTGELYAINRSLLDKSRISYCPTQNVGQVDVIYGAGLKTTIAAGQYFNLKLYVRDTVYKNDELKEKLRLTTISTIAACLKAKTVANSDIVDALRTSYGDDVISFEIAGLGGVNNLSLCTMVDNSARLTLRKRLAYRNDQTFAVEEDVTVEFIAHERAGVELEK